MTLFGFRYDDTPPDASAASAPSGWTRGPVTATVVATDTLAGMAQVYCRRADEGSYTTGNGISCPRTFTANGALQYYATDRAGNSFGSASSPLTYTIGNIDARPPTNPTVVTDTVGTVVSGTWQTVVSAPSFAWSGAADSQSGVAGYYWCLDSRDSCNPATPGAGTWTTRPGATPAPLGLGTFYLRAKTRDHAGNVSPTAALLFIFKYGAAPPLNEPNHIYVPLASRRN